MITIDRNSKIPFYIQIYSFFKESILNDSIPEGTILENSRDLAKAINVSRNTILNAYELLKSENFISSKKGYAYVVTKKNKYLNTEKLVNKDISVRHYKVSFSDFNSKIDEETAKIWYRYFSKKINEISYNDIQENYTFKGINELLTQIKFYLFKNRDIKCDESQIIVGNGIEYVLGIILSLIPSDIKKAYLNNDNNIKLKKIFTFHNKEIKNANEFEVSNVETKNSCIFITPSRVLDMSFVMKIENRKKLVAWANLNNSYIIENDYCSEYVYVDNIPSVFSYDSNNRTFYIGTFCSTLGSDIRTNYLVIPKTFTKKLGEICGYRSCANPFITQWILHNFIKTGKYEQLTRINKKRFEEHKNFLIKMLKEKFKNYIIIHPVESGLSITASFKANLTNDKIIEILDKHSVSVSKAPNDFLKYNNLINGINLNFSALSYDKICLGTDILYEQLKPYLKLNEKE